MAECLYYTTTDIMEILQVGRHKAIEIMRMFESRGQLLKVGDKTMRVKKQYFEDWLDGQDGSRAREKVIDRAFNRKK